MTDPQQAIAAPAAAAVAAEPSARHVLVLGGGGALGAAVLEALLGGARFRQVGVVVARPVSPALRGLQVVGDDAAAWARFAPESAVVVFDRERHANGRDDAFVQARPTELAATASRLRAAGVRQLVVALPHAPALLPQALKAGLASLDEGAVAALGFDHLVFLRMAQARALGAAEGTTLPQRLAGWMLHQLHWMIPTSEQPVRAQTVARVVAQLLVALPAAPAGTRVMPHELLWLAAQGHEPQALLQAWLAGQPLPRGTVARPRL